MLVNSLFILLESINVFSALALLLSLLASVHVFNYFGFFRRCYYISKLPGKKGWPLIGNLLDYNVPQEELIPLMVKLCDPKEQLSQTRILSRHFVMMYKPEAVEAVLSSPKYVYKGHEYYFMQPWLGSGLLTSEGRKWATTRRLLTPSFHFKILENFVDIFNEHSNFLASKLSRETGAIDIMPTMSMCTLDVICETAMGKKINAQKDDKSEYVLTLKEIADFMVKRSCNPFLFYEWLYKRTAAGKRHDECLKILHDFSRNVIQERKAEFLKSAPVQLMANDDEDVDCYGSKKRRAFLDLLLEVSDNGKVLSDADIQAEVDTFMFAGHDTTSMACSWFLFNMGAHPEHQRRVQEELDSIFGDSDRPVTIADMSKMKYLDMCIKETMRLYPPVPFISRELKEDIIIDGYTIPAGTFASFMLYVLHRNPDIFPDPETFNPDNFSPERVNGRHPFAYVPFSAGPRNCIGQKFAGMEKKVILSNVLRRVNIEAVHKPHELHHLSALVLRAKEGLMLKFTPRNQCPSS